MSINRIPGGVAIEHGMTRASSQAGTACIEAPGDTLLSAMTEAAATELGRPVRLVTTWHVGAGVYAAHYESAEL